MINNVTVQESLTVLDSVEINVIPYLRILHGVEEWNVSHGFELFEISTGLFEETA